MDQRSTIYDILTVLADYHVNRSKQYRHLRGAGTDPRVDILLEHLVDLEDQAAEAVLFEMKKLSPESSTYLKTGPTSNGDAFPAAECHLKDEPSFDDALTCALTPDPRLGELLEVIEECTAAPTVKELAIRLRDIETRKDQQIANFTRLD
jgi:hypothetical protein